MEHAKELDSVSMRLEGENKSDSSEVHTPETQNAGEVISSVLDNIDEQANQLAGFDAGDAETSSSQQAEQVIVEVEQELGRRVDQEYKSDIVTKEQSTDVQKEANRTELETLAKRRRMLEYAQRELSPDERIIATPMNSECKMAVCIPAYKESDGQMLTTLEMLAKQEGVRPEDFEVVVNVNSRPGADDSVVESNSRTLELLKSLGAKNKIDESKFSSEALSRLKALKDSGLVVHAIDKTTKGNETEPIDDDDFWKTGCMQPRKRAMDEVVLRFAMSDNPDGVIASLDADTKVSPDWVRATLEKFSDGGTQYVAGERRDGRDIDSEGNQIASSEVFQRLLDSWNTPERRSDGAFAELPDIKANVDRANISLMNNLIGYYNKVRELIKEKTGGGRSEAISHFKGGSGKMFRADVYMQHPKEIIKIMDGGGDRPPDVPESAFEYVGREKSEQGTVEADSQIDALAIYPESRIRSWDVKDEDSSDPYKDFNDLHNPFGSSGKENAYAVAAGLKHEIPTTYNLGTDSVRSVIQKIGNGNELTAGEEEYLRAVFTPEERADLSQLSSDDIKKMMSGDADTLHKWDFMVKKVSEVSSSDQSITDALRHYGQLHPGEQTHNPEKFYFGTLVEQLSPQGDSDIEVRRKLRDHFNLDDDTITGLAEAAAGGRQQQEQYFIQNVALREKVSSLPDQVDYKQAADLYEKLLR